MQLRLPIVAVPVRLAVAGRAVIDAELFVADVARKGRTQLLDDIAALLDHDAEFVPVRVADKTRLYAKRAVAWVAVARGSAEARPVAATGDDDDLDFDEMPSEVMTLFDREHQVAIELAAGGELRGALFDSSPADRPRLADHLNGGGRFVRLWTANEHFLVNKAHILQVSEQ